MLEPALFTALGFAVAALLALMVAPAVWRQAVRITRNRIEASVPLTLNEIQADKDQLRAEFAMSTRRLEMNLDKLRERASVQVIEINRKRDQLSKVAEDLRLRQGDLDAATAEGRRLETELADRETKLAKLEQELVETSNTLDIRAKQLDEYEQALKAATADVDSHRAELKNRDARLETTSAEATRLAADIAAARADHERERERAERLAAALEDARTRIVELETALDTGTAETRPLAEAVDEMAQRQIEELQTQNVRLEADLAQSLLRSTAMAEQPNQENADRARDDLAAENERLTAELARLRTEMETQKVELAAAQLAGRDDYESERRENALVRERLNDLAARVTAVTAEMEGPDSAIERILRETPEPERFPADAYDTPDGKPPASLADRIRALKQLADE